MLVSYPFYFPHNTTKTAILIYVNQNDWPDSKGLAVIAVDTITSATSHGFKQPTPPSSGYIALRSAVSVLDGTTQYASTPEP